MPLSERCHRYMVIRRHALLFPCNSRSVTKLLTDLATSEATRRLHFEHAAIIDHDASGDLDITVAGEGPLGELIGHRVGASALIGPLLMLAVAAVGSEEDALQAAQRSPESNVHALTQALPQGCSALLLVVPSTEITEVRRIVRAATHLEFLQFDVAPRLEPWLASKVDIDLQVEVADTTSTTAAVAS